MLATAASAFALPHSSATGLSHRAVCGAAGQGFVHCLADVVTDKNGVAFDGKVNGNASIPAGYSPLELQSAYNLPSTTAGSGQTVAVVDAYDDPTAERDLGVYRSQFGLPACTTANGCFRRVNQSGGARYPRANSGWAQEISLDLDMVSAICPNCKILLVEASSNSLANLGAAVNEAVKLGATEISNSYGGNASSSDPSYDSFFKHAGIAITASSGDNGYGVDYPAASQYVTAVGGTSLTKASNARGWAETGWSGAGSGCSAFDPKPTWQTDTGCSKRTVTDVSAVADPNTGVSVYDTYSSLGSSGWMVFGGTSVASPIIASVYALAGNAASIDASFPYSHTGSLNDVTSGSNGSCGTYLCIAGSGYDGPTGLGTPNGIGAF
jgi:subtilase family serine protease